MPTAAFAQAVYGSILGTVTDPAPATAAPCGSVTAPKMLPYTACANAAVGISMHRHTNDTASTIQNFVFIELLRVDTVERNPARWALWLGEKTRGVRLRYPAVAILASRKLLSALSRRCDPPYTGRSLFKRFSGIVLFWPKVILSMAFGNCDTDKL